jgi:hypothetical protein
MKKTIVLALLTAVFATVAPVTAQGKVAAPQEETGTVLLPGPGPNGETTGGCWTGWARRSWIASNGATAGPFGSMFQIDKSTWNGNFKLEVSGPTGSEDLDVTFYADPGKIDPVNDPAQQSGIIETGSYLTREAGGEAGTVPPSSTVALVCLAIGSGANAEWTYSATPPKKKKK